MWRIELPFSDARLMLLQRWSHLGKFADFFLLLGLASFTLWIVFRLYRQELTTISKGYARILLVVRSLIILTVVLLLYWRPVIAHSHSEEVPSQLFVAVDLSDSMGVFDHHRSDLEKLELIKELSIYQGKVPSSTLDNWLQSAKRSDYRFTETAEYHRLLEEFHLFARKHLAMRVLDPRGKNFLGQMQEKHQIRLHGFSQESHPLSVTEPGSNPLISESPTGNRFTDLKVPLLDAIQLRTSTEKLVGVVIFSDGQHNWGVSPQLRVQELADLGIPVHFVVCGPKDPPPDLAIIAARASPPAVFQNAYATVECRLLINNMPPGTIRVSLNLPDKNGKPVSPVVQEFPHDGNNQQKTVQLLAKMVQSGKNQLQLTAEHLPNQPTDRRKDTQPANNQRPLTIHVTADKAKVLVVDSEVRWEFHYLQTALERDSTMAMQRVVFLQPRLQAGESPTRDAGLPQLKLPTDPEALLDFDCIILGDLGLDELTLEYRQRLEKYVADRGGTLVLLAGKRSMPMQIFQDPIISKLLPISQPIEISSESGRAFRITAEGEGTGFLRMSENAGASSEIWQQLPHHYWAVTGIEKPGSVVLARSVEADQPFDGTKSESGAPILVRQHYGFGRVIYLGIDSTWRWRFKRGDEYNHRFWSQLIRWAASDRALITGNDFVRFGTREPNYRTDQEVEFVARFTDKATTLPPNQVVGIRLRLQNGTSDQVVRTIPLVPHPVIPKEWTSSIKDLPAGKYIAELVIPGYEQMVQSTSGEKLKSPFLVLPTDTGELVDLSVNRNFMLDIADKTGGKVVEIAEVDQLSEFLKAQKATRTYITETHLGQSWWLLCLVIGFLTVEWMIRKFAGLA
ncbi:MAG: hypothetical protein R3B84_07485 [Zavarzinella sp.]